MRYISFLLILCLSARLLAQPPNPPQRGAPAPARLQNATAPSYVYTRGDPEILNFATEQDYDHLQELYRDTQNTQPEPGKTSSLYLRARRWDPVQPYAVTLPRDFSRGRDYPLVAQLHGLNFREVAKYA